MSAEEELAKTVLANSSGSGSTKKCWSCEAVTPYEIGWCDECRTKIPPDIIAALDFISTEPYAGAIRLEISEILKRKNLEENRPQRKIRAGLNVPPEIARGLAKYGEKPPRKRRERNLTPLNLDDLDI